MELAKEQKSGVFINGREQVVDLLRALAPEEKAKLLKNIGIRNPSIALELSEKCFSFRSVEELSEQELGTLLTYVNVQIVGIALRGCNIKFQRRTLMLMDRGSAEEAYHAMTANLSDEKNAVKKAQEKMLVTAMTLNRKRVIRLS